MMIGASKSGETVADVGRSARAISALVLDDSDFDRQRLCRIGRSSGLDISIDAVPSIAEMSRRLDEEDFDLVLIDYRLGDGDGIEAVDVVRNHARNSGAATVMISGEAATDVAVTAMRHGCNDFVDKAELTPELFRARMVAALDRAVHNSEIRLADALSPARLRAAFVAAFDPETVQAILGPVLRPLVRDALAAALRNTSISGALHRDGELETFVEQFLQPDSFVF